MHVLIVYSHPNPESFTHALMESFSRGLQKSGHTYEVVDLYKTEFNPNFTMDDFGAFVGGPVPDDVLEQQKKVAAADAFAFICPVFWMNLPANMISWIVRVPGVEKVDYVFFYRALAVEDSVRAKYLTQAYELGKNFEEKDQSHAA